jgi:hypothetical protein
MLPDQETLISMHADLKGWQKKETLTELEK